MAYRSGMEPMFAKTLGMLDAIPPGTFVPDSQACSDPAELEALGRVLNRLA
jgi:hypothetical protein